MEKESQPADHRLEPEEPEPVTSPGGAAAAPIYDVYLDEEEAYLEGLDVPAAPVYDADTEGAAAAADLVEMDERELGLYPASSGASVGFGARATAANFLESGTFDFESIHEVETGAGNSRIPGALQSLPRPPTPSTVGVGAAASPARQTILSQDAGGSSSSQQVPGPGVAAAATVPSMTLPVRLAPRAGRCGAPYATAPRARPIGPADDPVSVKRRALLADAASWVMFPAMEEGHDNGWYEAIVGDGTEKLEQPEKQRLHESLQLCLPRSEPCNPAVAAAGEGEEEEEGGFSLPKFCQRWGVSPSDLEPDAPGPSTTKVPPLADHEDPGERAAIPCPTRRAGKENGVLHPEMCKKAIDYGAFDDWGARLTESALPPDRRAYCPNRRCGVILETSGEAELAMAPCPACKHLLCATCGMEWSPQGAGGEHDCAKGPDAALVKRLAQEHQWKRCPNCKMIVESFGCNRMTCSLQAIIDDIFFFTKHMRLFHLSNPNNFVISSIRKVRLRLLLPVRAPHEQGAAGLTGLLEPCRCLDAGLAFAFAHHHQAHHVDLNVPPPHQPPLQQQEVAAMDALMNELPVWDEEPPVVFANRLEGDDGIHSQALKMTQTSTWKSIFPKLAWFDRLCLCMHKGD
ncbi:hypothetical protein ZWY2020_059510 [Hordeum vulgare]|nr:hypothetical protein ZWY2020_059510 [Hordeum vulgare]